MIKITHYLPAPSVIVFIAGGATLAFSKFPGLPRWFTVWCLVCIVVLSPFRYILLQLLVASSFPVQSFPAFFSVLVLALYIPIVFGLTVLIGLGLPFLATIWTAFRSLSSPTISAPRIIVGAILAPITSSISYSLFFFVLQYTSVSTHWLRAEDVIGATNGPAQIAYELALGPVLSLPVADVLIPETHTSRDMLRNHIASYYLGGNQFSRYLALAYPLTSRRSIYEIHCAESLPAFTIRAKIDPIETQRVELCTCIWNNLGQWERETSQKLSQHREDDVSWINMKAYPARFGKALEKCGGMQF